MSLQYDAFERRAAARAAVRNQLERTGHSLEFHPAERVGLVSGRIRRLIKKAFHIFSLGKESRKCDHELMARYNARRDELMARYNSVMYLLIWTCINFVFQY